MIASPRHKAIVLSSLALCATWPLRAQEAPAREDAPGSVAPVLPDAPAPPPEDGVTTLDALKVTAPPPKQETLDLYRFRNPIDAGATVFGKSWNETPSLEEIGKRGGFVQLGIMYALGKAGEAVTRTPGWKHPIQSATARPPPAFSQDQIERAAKACEADCP